MLSGQEFAKLGERDEVSPFSEIGVKNFKSFKEERRIKLGNLTILAGANSSGKSSFMQPLLLMKQTIEASYDPGALLLSGPNIQFTSGEQLISKISPQENYFTVYLATSGIGLKSSFSWTPGMGFDIAEQISEFLKVNRWISLRPSMNSHEIQQALNLALVDNHPIDEYQVLREYCFLQFKLGVHKGIYRLTNRSFIRLLSQIIHVPALRGNPTRSYQTAAVRGTTFVGQFESYVANIVDRFQQENSESFAQLVRAFQTLGLTDLIQTQRLNDTQIELRVGRVLGQPDHQDTVNIADVGFGVSQVLPVIVALLVAQPGQLVYIEQPEIHLHPRAQVALAEIFADAAHRGVRVVVETHSELFLLGIQTLVAEEQLDPNLVKLHWFTRQPDGSSQVTSADLDTTGAFGDWPEDFGSTALALENRYLNAAEKQLWQTSHG
ncbi:AAA family ATPase [Alkalinema sp. FACHB-956]|uniref:AAA family ATPase n=1 Tax=Alkalinema sp. FACHB-956 TaxID=2692768 RepID=UPI0016899AF2|nr:AAA family ATPase [Alkalinema sp. FACHB-956]MBD2325267.1 DUF3696 domain-containing protein [Alkalinema sp. FACHB-956]